MPRRGAVMLGVVGLHLVLAALWVRDRAAPPVPPPVAMTLLAFAAPVQTPVPVPAAAAAMPPAPLPAAVVEAPAIPDAPVSALAVAATGRCAPLDAVQAALAAEPQVQSAIATVPADARSVAQAIVVWNAGWAAIAATADAPLAPVRDVVARTLAVIPAQCLAEDVVGPRLILIDTGGGTSVLAFGSGTWRWSDLAALVRS